MVVTRIDGVSVAGKTPPEVVAIVRGAGGTVTVEAEAPGGAGERPVVQRRPQSGLGHEGAEEPIEAGGRIGDVEDGRDEMLGAPSPHGQSARSDGPRVRNNAESPTPPAETDHDNGGGEYAAPAPRAAPSASPSGGGALAALRNHPQFDFLRRLVQSNTRKPDYIESAAGKEKEYLTNYVEGMTLGQGEFGVVKLVTDVREKDSANAKSKACKYLKKGYVFKDNTLTAPVKRSVLEAEVDILRRLDGKCYCLRLCDVYESPSQIYMITEFCEGGEMMPWVSKAFQDTGLRTEDVSRISYELWSAVDHCAKNKVMHRDIKPENIMFVDLSRSSQLRLIDFGSGRCDELEQTPGNEVDRHTTFAGSAFYISPEMFQHSYTNKTDVWSAGAALYVLVAGYPADQLQAVFDKLQSTKPNRLKSLPNMPSNIPESFYEMLEGALQHRHKSRLDAGSLMKGEFSQFHTELSKEADTVPEMLSSKSRRTTSVVLEGSVKRHNAYLGYQKFERSLTTILATILTNQTVKKLLSLIERMNQKKSASIVSNCQSNSSSEKNEGSPSEVVPVEGNAEKLKVATIKELMSVLTSMEMVDERERDDVLKMIQGLRGYMFYETFAYHVASLQQLINEKEIQKHRRDVLNMPVHGSRVFLNTKKRTLDGRGSGKGDKFFSKDLDGSDKF